MFPEPSTQPTLTVDEAAKWLGLSRSSIYEAVRSGELPSIRVGHRILLPTAVLKKVLQLDQPSSAA